MCITHIFNIYAYTYIYTLMEVLMCDQWSMIAGHYYYISDL